MTLKQKLAAQKILENPSKPLGQVMRDVGYSENSAIAPEKNLTSSKGWKELMDEKLPDDKLTTVHADALTATKWNDFTGEREPDHITRLKGVDMGYKVKGKYIDQQGSITNILVIPSELMDKYGITSDAKASSTG